MRSGLLVYQAGASYTGYGRQQLANWQRRDVAKRKWLALPGTGPSRKWNAIRAVQAKGGFAKAAVARLTEHMANRSSQPEEPESPGLGKTEKT